MTHRFCWLALALGSMILLPACSSSDDPMPTGPEDPTPEIAKSAKRGLAFDLTHRTDMEILKEGVSWWYNWYYRTDAPAGYEEDYQMDFLPMLWGHNPGGDYSAVRTLILGNAEIEYLLVMNEPNLVDQANITPSEAAADWVLYEALLADLSASGREVALVGPQITWGTMSGFEDPVVWMDAFYEAYRAANGGRDPRIDYLGFHWYDFGLAEQLNRLRKYDKQIWITEMANWNPQIDSYAKQATQMTEMVALAESRSDVFRYAWFIGRASGPDDHKTYLLGSDPGTLTSIGALYLSLPYNN